MLVTTKALPLVDTYEDSTMRACRLNSNIDNYQCVDANIDNQDISFQLSGQFLLLASDVLTNADIYRKNIYPKSKTNKNGLKDNNYKFQLHPRLVKAMKKEFNERNIQDGFESLKIEGFTRLTTISKKTAERVIYYASPYIMGSMWYDWSFFHFQEVTRNGKSVQKFLPCKNFGFYKNQ